MNEMKRRNFLRKTCLGIASVGLLSNSAEAKEEKIRQLESLLKNQEYTKTKNPSEKLKFITLENPAGALITICREAYNDLRKGVEFTTVEELWDFLTEKRAMISIMPMQGVSGKKSFYVFHPLDY